ncbi:DinB family protein [Gracilibacillus dipsosauri]|uniref:DinB-like domain-containing protein n=1 Tax=Gracilibacillus dipsosauri TaxID=178340 RepID=A0A317KZ96_9BACI|nr:DinB family protein [Gracilibacillus dipsosauri]PWU68745.1 hypothetical protein DLJ74_09990 [Gracilibacillus dipsosauri]
MKNIYLVEHFQRIYKQRKEIKIELWKGKEWQRPSDDKWSWGETYYHLYLMMRWFRRLSKIYIPLAIPFATLRKNKPYPVHSTNIYKQYQLEKKKPMKAPFILVPPKDQVDFGWLVNELDKETKQIEKIVLKLSDDVAGHIRYIDPLASNPNLIESIHLLGIHEKHHFSLCEKYYNVIDSNKNKYNH